MMDEGAIVFIEATGTRVKNVTVEVFSKLTDIGFKCDGIFLTDEEDDDGIRKWLSSSLGWVAGKIYVLRSRLFSFYDGFLWARKLSDFIGKIGGQKYKIFASGATGRGKDLLPAIAACLGRACVSDCIDVERSEDGEVFFTRAYYGGKVNARVRISGDGPLFVSFRPNVFSVKTMAGRGSESVEVEFAGVEFSEEEAKLRVIETSGYAYGQVDIQEADVVVCGGRGVGSKEKFSLIYELADAVGGVVGASRAAVDAGWAETGQQVGKSGKTISALLYIGVGVSGAIHHVMGMQGCKNVIVINKDENAPFFKNADYAIVGNLFEVVPALIKKLKG